MYRVLKPKGKIEVHTNNAGWLFYHNSKSSFKTHYGGYEKKSVGGENDKHYALYTWHHLHNHLKAVGLKDVSSYSYSKTHFKLSIRIIQWILLRTRLKWMTHPQICVIGVK